MTSRNSLSSFIWARVFATLAVVLVPLTAQAQIGVPKPNLWERWTRAAQRPTIMVEDRSYAAFLARYVRTGRDGINRVGYGRVTPADTALLKQYLNRMQAVDVDALTRPQQMAYWINLYNAATIDVMLDAWPVGSIRKIDSPVFGFGPWGRKRLTVKGEPISLNDIEHRILRPIWRDVRIHYAVNCASLGCPNLAMAPYRAETLNAMLEEAARDFINHPRAFAEVDGKLIASNIYSWYGIDWGGKVGVLAHARKYASGRTAALLARKRSIDDYRYDWSANVAP